MKFNIKQFAIYMLGAVLVVGGVVFAGSLNPSVGTDTTNFVTLHDIYQKLYSNDYTPSSHYISTSSAPASSMHTLSDIYDMIVTVPTAPTSIVAALTATREQATVSFTAPTSNGGSSITGYVAFSNHGQFGYNTASPITVYNLNTDSSYTFTVRAINAVGAGLPSADSNSVSPLTYDHPGIPTATSGVQPISPGNFRVYFGAPDDDGGRSISSYTITATGISGNAVGRIYTTSGNPPSATIGIGVGDCVSGVYSITVQATNSEGTGSALTVGTAE